MKRIVYIDDINPFFAHNAYISQRLHTQKLMQIYFFMFDSFSYSHNTAVKSMSQLIENYCEKSDKSRLSEFVSLNTKSLILYFYNKTFRINILLSKRKSTTPTKIDGVIVNEEFGLEVAIIEVSGPNWKVDTAHFLEDKKKKPAKNMKSMYETIINVKENPCLVSKRELKVYGFQVYCKSLFYPAIIFQLLNIISL